ncbi:Zinc-regulated transporter 2 [Nakaseomyces bracarensis]|uniref:Zinc-regulated transporter 2 n=1 Tax=Nakaseomyces bracarensis TaxID=273131 RepID=A0ABR4NRW9_9SACH
MGELLTRQSTPACEVSNDYNGDSGLRILAVFIILISSGLGAYFPILSSKYSFIRLPDWCFFIAKFFGSGVIIATAFVHLLQPASEALTNECLGGTFEDYPWAFGICLMSLFMLFLSEIIAHHLVDKKFGSHHHDEIVDESNTEPMNPILLETNLLDMEMTACGDHVMDMSTGKSLSDLEGMKSSATEISYNRESTAETWNDNVPAVDKNVKQYDSDYISKVFVLFVLEFGIIFHSVFVGLSLSVAGDEFRVLFIVITFHQMFEGLGLGTRIAETDWPTSKWYTPWIMAFAFTITSPIAVAIGIGVRHTWVPGSRKALITNGVFDSISSGILIYTGLIELMAHEFLFSNQFKDDNGFRNMIYAYLVMCSGAALMALLGRWA